MYHPKRKLILGAILLMILAGIFTACVILSYTTVNLMHKTEKEVDQIRHINQSIEKAGELQRLVNSIVLKSGMDKMYLCAEAFASAAGEDWDGKSCFYQNGAIIRADGDTVEYPEGFPEEVKFDPASITGRDGALFAPKYIDEETGEPAYYVVYYCRTESPYYYIEWTDSENYENRVNGIFDLEKTMGGIVSAFDTQLLSFYAEDAVSSPHQVTYHSPGLPGYETAEEYGITQEMLDTAFEDPGTADLDTMGRSISSVVIGDTIYEMYLQKNDASAGLTSWTAYLLPVVDFTLKMAEQSLVSLAAFLIIGIVILVWFASVFALVRRHKLNENQIRELRLGTTAKKAFSILAISAVVFFVVSALSLSLYRLYEIYTQTDSALLSLRQRIEENNSQKTLTEDVQRTTYEEYALTIGSILTDNPEIASPETLQSFCDTVNADYLMLFDHDGNELMTNSRYTDLVLGTKEDSATYDFRSLLQGVPLITHEPMTDEQTKLTNVMIGVSVGRDTDKEGYRALLMAVPEDAIYGSSMETTGGIMEDLVSERTLAFCVDPEDHIITAASDSSLVGSNVLTLGLPEAALQDEYRDFFVFNDRSWYGSCMEYEGLLYFYTVEQISIYTFVVPCSLFLAAVGALLLLILLLHMLKGYRKGFSYWSTVGSELQTSEDEVNLPSGKRMYSRDPSKRWKTIRNSYGLHTPARNARMTLLALLVITIALAGMLVLSERSGEESSLIRFILRGQWTRGFNLFSFTSILILLGEVIVIASALNLLLRLGSGAFGTKGETICRLLLDLVGYASVIVFVYFSFYYLGFDPGTLLASLGLLSFALSLGAKDLVTDIVAGLSIVFEGEFQVGDIIDVGGFRGRVLEIGVRTTKLEGRGGNIKIIRNNNVSNVLNMTRKTSWYPMSVSISSEQPLQQVEQMLSEQLPIIGESIPQIISGPFYKGIISMGKGSVTLSIIAECNEEDYYRVELALNHAIRDLFEKEELTLL